MDSNNEQMIQTILTNQFEKMNKVLNNISTKIDNINERVLKMEEKMKETIHSPDMKTVINEKMVVKNKDQIFKYLCSNNISSDMKIIKDYYLSKIVDGEVVKLLCPIKFESYRKFYFWNGHKWITDMDGYYISKVLADNLQRLYLRNNNIRGCTDKMDKIFENQKYINSMKTDKYKRLLVKEIRMMINCL
jgi:anion-transporting  ArsA/GET3 family ATPase